MKEFEELANRSNIFVWSSKPHRVVRYRRIFASKRELVRAYHGYLARIFVVNARLELHIIARA